MQVLRLYEKHYTDGDLLNNKTPVGRAAAGHESLVIWDQIWQQRFCIEMRFMVTVYNVTFSHIVENR